MRIKIISSGLYVPPLVETAEDLAPRIGRSADWIISRTGVARRHISEIPVEKMAANAAKEALQGVDAPDLILNASTTPRQLIPDTSVFIQRELGLDGIPSFTIHTTCLSFLSALHVASSFIQAGAYRRILVVSAEIGSVSRNFAEPESASLFGDGAAAVVIEPTPEGEDSALLAYRMTTWPKGAELTELRGAGTRFHPNDPATRPVDNLFHMNGPGVYRMARRRVAVVLRRVFEQAGIVASDLDLIVPHQASGGALEAAPRYGLPAEKLVNVVAEYGNCIAASMPMALAVALRQGRLERGQRVLLLGTGAGLSVAAAILRW